jgi:hypothetical protein
MSMLRRTGLIALVLGLAFAAVDLTQAQTGQGAWSKAAPMNGVRSELQAVTVGGKPEDKRQLNLL